MKYTHNDGGAPSHIDDSKGCSVRATAIATGMPWEEVYDNLMNHALNHGKEDDILDTGLPIEIYRPFMEQLGWRYVNTSRILFKNLKFPTGSVIVYTWYHYSCVVDGVINDIFDPTVNSVTKEPKEVLGYFVKEGKLLTNNTIYYEFNSNFMAFTCVCVSCMGLICTLADVRYY